MGNGLSPSDVRNPLHGMWCGVAAIVHKPCPDFLLSKEEYHASTFRGTVFKLARI